MQIVGYIKKKEFHLIRLVVWCGSDGMDSLSFFLWGRTENLGKCFILAHLACNILSLTVLFGPILGCTDTKFLAEGINNVPRGPELRRYCTFPISPKSSSIFFLINHTRTSSFTTTMENLNPICLY